MIYLSVLVAEFILVGMLYAYPIAVINSLLIFVIFFIFRHRYLKKTINEKFKYWFLTSYYNIIVLTVIELITGKNLINIWTINNMFSILIIIFLTISSMWAWFVSIIKDFKNYE
jgi:hypothetical protein